MQYMTISISSHVITKLSVNAFAIHQSEARSVHITRDNGTTAAIFCDFSGRTQKRANVKFGVIIYNCTDIET